MSKGSKRATFYVQVEPVWSRWAKDEHGEKQLDSIRAVAITQKQPQRPRGGTLSVKLSIEVPDGAFLPLRPEAVIVIPEGMVLTNPIEVEAVDPQ